MTYNPYFTPCQNCDLLYYLFKMLPLLTSRLSLSLSLSLFLSVSCFLHISLPHPSLHLPLHHSATERNYSQDLERKRGKKRNNKHKSIRITSHRRIHRPDYQRLFSHDEVTSLLIGPELAAGVISPGEGYPHCEVSCRHELAVG